VYDGQQPLLIVVMFKQRRRQSLTSRGAKKSFRGHNGERRRLGNGEGVSECVGTPLFATFVAD